MATKSSSSSSSSAVNAILKTAAASSSGGATVTSASKASTVTTGGQYLANAVKSGSSGSSDSGSSSTANNPLSTKYNTWVAQVAKDGVVANNRSNTSYKDEALANSTNGEIGKSQKGVMDGSGNKRSSSNYLLEALRNPSAQKGVDNYITDKKAEENAQVTTGETGVSSVVKKVLGIDTSKSRWEKRGVGTTGTTNKDGTVTWKTKMDYANELEKQYENDKNSAGFGGRFETNYDLGKLQEEISLASTEYLNDPTEENLNYLNKVKEIYSNYLKLNEDIAGTGGILSNSFASYLPQLGTQLTTTSDTVVSNPLLLLHPKVAMTVGSGVSAYNEMLGAAFSNLMQYTGDADLAKAAAEDEANISSVIEMGDTILDLAAGAGGAALKAAGGTVVRDTATVAATTFVQKLTEAAKAYGVSIGGEGNEEAMQQIVTLANQMRLADGKGNGGMSELLNYCLKVLDQTYGSGYGSETSASNQAEIQTAAAQGRSVAAILGLANIGASAVIGNVNTNSQTETAPTTAPVSSEAQAVLNNILDGTSEGYTKAATQILSNPEVLELYEQKFGTVDGTSNTEKANNIATTLREADHQAAVEEAKKQAPSALDGAQHPMAMPSQDIETPHPMAQPTQEGADPNTDGQVGAVMQIREMQKGGISYSDATKIIADPILRRAFEDMYGITLSDNRATAKEQIVEAGKTTPAEKPTPITYDESNSPYEHAGEHVKTDTAQRKWGAHQNAGRYPKTHNKVNPLVSDNGVHKKADSYQGNHSAPTTETVKENNAPTYTLRGNLVTAEENTTAEKTQNKGTSAKANESSKNTQEETENAVAKVKPAKNGTAEANTVMDAKNGAAYAESMPNKDGGERTHQYTERSTEDTSVDPELRSKIKATLKQYGVKTNKKTMDAAVNLMSQGTEKAAEVIEGRLYDAKVNDKKMHAEDAPLAVMVANELTKDGQVDRANAIMSDMAVELTAAGQFIQAVSILRNATSPATLVQTVQKALDKINSTMEKKGLNYTAEMTEDEKLALSQIDPTDMNAFQSVYKSIMQRVGAEMPATFTEKFREYRHVNMLLNPKTLITNVGANIPTIVIRILDDKISGAVQDIAVKTGKLAKEDQTKTFGVASKEQKSVANEVYDGIKDSLNDDSGKYEFNADRTIFKTHELTIGGKTFRLGGLIPQAIEGVMNQARLAGDKTVKLDKSSMEYLRRATYAALGLGDAPFVKLAFIDTLANYMKAHDITTIDGVTDEAIELARSASEYYTYKNGNMISDGINKVKNNVPGLGEAVDVIQPFTKTPANIALMVVQHDPLIGGAISAIQAIKGDTLSSMESGARAATGGAIMAIGFALRAFGWATGGEDDDADKAAFDEATGNSPYSFGGRYSYDWAEPGGSMLAFGADMYDAIVNNKDEGLATALWKAVFTKGDAFFNMGMMQNISKILGKNSYGSPTETLVTNAINSLFSQFVPSILSQTAAVMDSQNRATTDKTQNAIVNAVNKVRSKLPGDVLGIGRETLPESVNVKGETETRGGILQRALESYILPGTVNHGEMTDADAYIYDLYERTGSKTVFPQKAPYEVEFDDKKITMTAEERATYQKTMSNAYYDTVNALYDDGTLDSLDDTTSVKLLSKIEQYATDMAKAELAASRGIDYSSDIQNLVNGEERIGEDRTALDKDNVPTYIATNQLLSDSIKNKDYDSIDAIVKMYDSFDDNLKTVVDERLTDLKQFQKAADAGIGAETWMTYKDSIKTVQKEADSPSDNSAVKYKAIVDSDLPDSEKQKLIDMDDNLSETWKSVDSILSGHGLSKEQIYDFLYDADYTYDSDTDTWKSDGKLGPYEACVALQNMDIPENTRREIFNEYADLAEAGRYDNWSRDTGYNKWTKYDYDWTLSKVEKYDSYSSYTRSGEEKTKAAKEDNDKKPTTSGTRKGGGGGGYSNSLVSSASWTPTGNWSSKRKKRGSSNYLTAAVNNLKKSS